MRKLFYILTLLLVIGSCKKVEQDELTVKVAIPSAFRPSSATPCPSGSYDCNTVFKVVVDFTQVQSGEMSIYNFQQELIYKSTNLMEGWNGTIRNAGTTPCPQGSYHYLIKITELSGGKSKLLEGTVLLLR